MIVMTVTHHLMAMSKLNETALTAGLSEYLGIGEGQDAASGKQ